VRFPSNKKVEDMADFNTFNLGKDGASVSVKPWQGDLEHFVELEEVWLKVKGIPPKWSLQETSKCSSAKNRGTYVDGRGT
jgi:hypothetical protein